MTSPGVVALECVRCASGTSVGSLSLKRQTSPKQLHPALDEREANSQRSSRALTSPAIWAVCLKSTDASSWLSAMWALPLSEVIDKVLSHQTHPDKQNQLRDKTHNKWGTTTQLSDAPWTRLIHTGVTEMKRPLSRKRITTQGEPSDFNKNRRAPQGSSKVACLHKFRRRQTQQSPLGLY